MIFEDDKDREQAALHLPTLKHHPGWKYIERALDENIAHFTEKLRTKRAFASLEELGYVQDRLADIEGFKQLPETLVKAATDRTPEADDADDVYDIPPINVP